VTTNWALHIKSHGKLAPMTGHLYFIGIAGHTMRGLALAARDNGYIVTGLDETAVPPGSDWLDEHDFKWFRQYDSAQLNDVTRIIITGAHVTMQSPAILEAQLRGIAVVSYAQFFGELTQHQTVIAVAGTHGKTTTTALIAWLLESAGQNPDYLVGIRPFNFENSVRVTGAPLVVVEADEYKASALEGRSKAHYYHPNTLVLTAVEHDHPDMFPALQDVVTRFSEIVTALPRDGQLIACAESKTVLSIARSAPCPVVTYGLKSGDIRARNIAYLPQGLELEIEQDGDILGHVAINLYGHHNVLNTLAAVIAAMQHGLSFEDILRGAASFKGAYRRFNIISRPEAPVTIIDDYAHHPTEVATNLEAAKLHFKGRRIVVVFRPHTYSRTAALLNEYHQAFADADLAFITDIEGARETGNLPSINGDAIVDGLSTQSYYEPDRAKIADHVAALAKTGDVILCLSVSGHQKLAEELNAELNPLKPLI
jgi:UDP-N-acetylmuramate--alanine ligase